MVHIFGCQRPCHRRKYSSVNQAMQMVSISDSQGCSMVSPAMLVTYHHHHYHHFTINMINMMSLPGELAACWSPYPRWRRRRSSWRWWRPPWWGIVYYWEGWYCRYWLTLRQCWTLASPWGPTHISGTEHIFPHQNSRNIVKSESTFPTKPPSLREKKRKRT